MMERHEVKSSNIDLTTNNKFKRMLECKRRKVFVNFIAIGLLMVFASGCATVTSPVIVNVPNCGSQLKGVLPGESVVLALPQTLFVSTEDESPVSPSECDSEGLQALMSLQSRQGIVNAGMKPLEVDNIGGTNKVELVRVLAELDKKQAILMRKTPRSPELVAQLRMLACLTGAKAILLQKVRVKLGVGGGWDPNSGAIWQSTSSTSIRVALVSLLTGDILWGKEAFIRALPSDSRFSETIQQIYSDKKE